DDPDDYVLATGESFSVRQFVEYAFRKVGIQIEWRGTEADEKGFEQSTGRLLVEVDPRYFRPTEVELLVGDPTQARQKLGWTHQTSFEELVAEMVAEDLAAIPQGEWHRFEQRSRPPLAEQLAQPNGRTISVY